MSTQKDWNPDLFLKFKNERNQPARDLISRLNINDPSSILDMGCRPGNSGELLLKNWLNTSFTGIDTSPQMIDKAKQLLLHQNWVVQDAMELDSSKGYDLVFSNAALQWITGVIL